MLDFSKELVVKTEDWCWHVVYKVNFFSGVVYEHCIVYDTYFGPNNKNGFS